MSMPLARRTWRQQMLGPWRRQWCEPCPSRQTVSRDKAVRTRLDKAALSRPSPWGQGSFAVALGLQPWGPWRTAGYRLVPAQHLAARLHPVQFSPAQQMQFSSAQQMQFFPAQQMQFLPAQQMQVSPAQQMQVLPAQQMQFSPAQQMQFLPAQQMQFSPAQQMQFSPARQMHFSPAQQMQISPAQQMQPGRRLSVQASVGRRKAQSPPEYLSPHVVTNIYLLQRGYREAAIFEAFSLPWLQDFPPTDHVSIGNQAAHALRSKNPTVCAFVFDLKEKSMVRMRFPGQDTMPQVLQLVDQWERLGPQPRQAFLQPDGDVGVATRAKGFEQHLYKMLRNWQAKPPKDMQREKVLSMRRLMEPEKIFSGGREVGNRQTGVRFNGVVFNDAPAIAIDFTFEGGLPVLEAMKLLPRESSLVGAKVRTPRGFCSSVVSVQPLTDELRQFLLSRSAVEANKEAIRKAPLGELVLNLDSPTGAIYQWVSSQLDLISHPGSYQATMALEELESSSRSKARVAPQERRRRIQEIANTFTGALLNASPVGSTARWSSGADKRFGSVDLSSHSRKMGGGVSLPMDASQYKLADVLLSKGVRKLGRDPAALAVLYAADDSRKMQELKSLARPMLGLLMQALGDREGSPSTKPSGSDRDGWPGVLKQGFTEWEVTDGVKSMGATAEEMRARGIEFVLCCSGHRKGSREGEELWESLKKECFSRGMPTQSVFGDTLRNPNTQEPLGESYLKLVAGNVICSVATKLGHAPWTLTPLTGTPVDFIVGIDVCRGFVDEEDRAAGVTVYTREGEPVLTKLTHRECDGETVSEEFLQESIPVGTIANSKVVVIRHGPFRGAETRQIQGILESCGAVGTFVEVIERSSFRVFSTEGEHAPVDSYIVLQPQEWVLVASKPHRGTAQPLRVLLKQNDLGYSMEQVVGLVAWLRRLPSVSLAAPKLPGPLHLADKMAGTRSRIGEAADSVDNRGLL